MATLRDLPNIGPYAENLLLRAGVDTLDKLKKLGSKEAFLRIRTVDPTICSRVLYGLEGAIEGCKDSHLDAAVKEDLSAYFKSFD